MTWCMYHTRDRCPFLTHMLNHSAMANNGPCQTQKCITCLWNNMMYRWDIWPRKLPVRCRDRAINVSKPGIGSVLGHPPHRSHETPIYQNSLRVYPTRTLHTSSEGSTTGFPCCCVVAYQKPYTICPSSYQQMVDMCTTQ